MTFATYLGNKVLDKTLRNTDYTVTTAYLSLHTADPGVTGTSEVAGGSYARQSSAWNVAASKSTSNSGTLTFSGMPATTVTHLGLWDAVSAGNFLGGGSLTVSIVTISGDSVVFNASGITVTLT